MPDIIGSGQSGRFFQEDGRTIRQNGKDETGTKKALRRRKGSWGQRQTNDEVVSNLFPVLTKIELE